MSPRSMSLKIGEFVTYNVPHEIDTRHNTSHQKIKPPAQMQFGLKSELLFFSRAFLFTVL